MLPLVTQPSQWQRFVLELTTSLKWDWHHCEQLKAEHTTITRWTNTSALHSVQPASGLVFSQTRFRVHSCFQCKSFSTHVFVHNTLRLLTSCCGDAADCTQTYAEVSESSQDWGCSFGLVMSAAETKPPGPQLRSIQMGVFKDMYAFKDAAWSSTAYWWHASKEYGADAHISCCICQCRLDTVGLLPDSLCTTCRPPPHTRWLVETNEIRAECCCGAAAHTCRGKGSSGGLTEMRRNLQNNSDLQQQLINTPLLIGFNGSTAAPHLEAAQQ